MHMGIRKLYRYLIKENYKVDLVTKRAGEIYIRMEVGNESKDYYESPFRDYRWVIIW
jgi:hypothetical protein